MSEREATVGLCFRSGDSSHPSDSDIKPEPVEKNDQLKAVILQILSDAVSVSSDGNKGKPRKMQRHKSARSSSLSRLPQTNGSVAIKPAREYWLENIKRAGSVRSRTMSGVPLTTSHSSGYLSSSDYLRHMVSSPRGQRRPQSGGLHSKGKFANSGASYSNHKDPIDMYDEIIQLKKTIQSVEADGMTLKTKLRRMEENGQKKDKQIEQLLNPSGCDEMRRSLGTKQADNSAVTNALKQKIFKLEQTLRQRETDFRKLESSLKTTKVEEMRVQLEAYYQEVLRLRAELSQTPSHPESAPRHPRMKEVAAKLRSLNGSVKTLTREKQKMAAENRTIRLNLEKTLETSRCLEKTHRKCEEGTEMNRKLQETIASLEKKLEEEREQVADMKTFVSKNSVVTEGKLPLRGSAQQCLEQLDRRETELLEEREKLRGVIRRLRQDRSHYKQKLEVKEKAVKQLQKESVDAVAELQAEKEKRRSPSLGRSSIRVLQSPHDSVSTTPEKRPRRISAIATKAKLASAPTRGNHENGSQQQDPVDSGGYLQCEALEMAAYNLRQQRAATTIQRNWKIFRQQKTALAAKEEAAVLIQSTLRGHFEREERLHTSRPVLASSGEGKIYNAGDVTVVQSALRAHMYREQYLRDEEIRDLHACDSDDSHATVTLDRSATATTSPQRRHFREKASVSLLDGGAPVRGATHALAASHDSPASHPPSSPARPTDTTPVADAVTSDDDDIVIG
ncbi:PREDICTED: IQ domain-containing protein E-like isoform X2 [Priapulus caudatus]|uniref:IQ domain-containing protein E-like isoform X2 n=1 Tax=Priapulus caudatus TaxID=37621 RepID=A0ABM1E7G3_PRICU|nr:PREDICTED: IQ domain-containing protein E-like isoform X2 [Priapulus caudatus]